ncbi:MAG: DUF6252 family protein [Bacteroidota bacterium]
MKRSIPFLLSIFFLAFFLSGCQKDKDDNPSPNIQNEEYFFECKLDGETFRAVGLNAYGTEFHDSYAMYGLGANDFVMYVSVDQSLGEGTHDMDQNTNAYVVYGNGRSYASLLDGGSGSVTITERTPTHLKGTFQATVVDFDNVNASMTVSEGKFEVLIR